MMRAKSFNRGEREVARMIAAAAFVVVSACSPTSSSDSAPASSSPSKASTTSARQSAAPSTAVSPADRAKRDATDAYLNMWRAYAAAGATSDWKAPALGQYATGIALTNLTRGLYADHRNGLVTKGNPVLNPTVSSVDPLDSPTKVIVSDCGDSTNWLKYHADTGQLADAEPGGRHAINAIVEKQPDDSWKVSDVGVQDVGTC
jgi:hypothetical protein